MIWGVGTGRCGTKSLAKDLGGIHEPQPWFKDEPVRWQLYGLFEKEITKVLEDRLSLDSPAIVDLQHSYIIPLIRKVDSHPEFYWMIRDPVGCLASHLSGGIWQGKIEEELKKIYPSYGWGDIKALDKAIYFWLRTNTIIYSEFERRNEPWTIQRPEQLKSHENSRKNSKALKAFSFSEEELDLIEEKCFPIWNIWKENLGKYG